MKKISRRDFFKLGWGALQASLAASLISKPVRANAENKDAPNIVLLICDAMSARNLSLYGYPRKTTPNLEKIAEQAHVYHNHYSGGNYTTPGTSTLLTGLLPWTHRAVNQAASVRRELAGHNIFRFLGNDYFKLAYTQNYWANYFLEQFSADINSLLPFSEFGMIDQSIQNKLFKKDALAGDRAIEKMLYYGNTLVWNFLANLYDQPQYLAEQQENYPKGFPVSGIHHNVFTLDDLFAGIQNQIVDLDANNAPYFAYLHIFPPHDPYRPEKDFEDIFKNDGYTHVLKHEHPLSRGVHQEYLTGEHDDYDSYIANLDSKIGNLIADLKERGILERTYFIIASDHGEMHERGERGHITSLLYDPVVKTPLVILVPGDSTRRDFFTPTSNADLLPTILSLASQEIPASCEGQALPGLGGVENPQRSVFMMDAQRSSAFMPFSVATYAIVKGNYKLHYYHGYPNKYQEYFEFFDLQEDPEELRDRYEKPKYAEIISAMKQELFAAISVADSKLISSITMGE